MLVKSLKKHSTVRQTEHFSLTHRLIFASEVKVVFDPCSERRTSSWVNTQLLDVELIELYCVAKVELALVV